MESLADRIEDAFARERAQAADARSREDIPQSYDRITRQWLTDVVCPPGSGVTVTDFDFGENDDGTTNRRRVYLKYSREDPSLPPSVFCKATQDLSNRLLVGHTGGAYCETVFYNDVRGLLNIEAPHSYLAHYDPDTFNSIIVLEDVSRRARFCRHDDQITFDQLATQIELLAEMHGRFLDGRDKEALARLPTWPDRFANTKRFGLEERCKTGFQKAEGVVPDRLFRRGDEVWPATLASVERHHALPHTLTHGDVHLRNAYLTTAGRIGMADWQCASRGHWGRDLAYVLSVSPTIENRRKWEPDLIRLYLDLIERKSGSKIPVADAREAYRQQLFSVLAWWTFTLDPTAKMPDMQPEDAILAFISRIATAIDDHDSLDSF